MDGFHENTSYLKLKNVSEIKNRTWRERRKMRKKIKQFKEELILEKNNLAIKKQSGNSLKTKAVMIQDYTISIAVAGSILDNAQSPELKTYLAGQIARAAAIFRVNEIIVFNDMPTPNIVENGDQVLRLRKKHCGTSQMVHILEYLECPQYLRKYYFPIHKDLEYAGLLNPLDIPHHLRVDDVSCYREGVVLDKPAKEGKGSYVYIGLNKSAIIDKILEPNMRVTVKLDEEKLHKKHFRGKAVSPSMPSKCDGLYWGYRVRQAKSLKAVFAESPFKGGYDVTIGTSDKGQSVDAFVLPPFKHLLIVFGGLAGLEACLELDESIEATKPSELFQFYLNTCPNQGSRTIRTEEAILITLAALRPSICKLKKR